MDSKFVAVFCFVGLLSTIPAANAQVKTLYSGPYQILFYKEPNVNFKTAKKRCIYYGSQLLKVDSQGIKDTISSYDTSDTRYWIGAKDTAKEGEFKWIDGTGVERRYSNWDNGEPNNGGGWGRNEDCVVTKNKGKWNDLRCNKEIEGFICQRVLKLVYKTHFLEFRRRNIDKASFYEAMTKCGQSGSRLVEISNKNLDKKIKQNIENSNPWIFYWLGGSDKQVEGEWKWNNRTEVNYAGWEQNEPNGGRRENCLGIMRTGWLDLNCSRKELYICEKVAASEIKVSAHDLEVSSADEQTTIVCSAKGFPFPTISWQKNGIAVSNQRSSNDLYQTQAQGEATLHLSGATLINEGVYTCLANNTIEGTDYAENTTSFVSVPSQVADITAFGHNCNTSITILWKPNRRAINAFHKIVVQNSTSYEFSFIVAPKHLHEAFLTDTTKSLSAYTNYTITILPCVSATDCKSEYAISTTALTGGIPGEVRSPNTSMTSTSSCEVTWSKPDLIFGEYIYQVHVTEALQDVPKGYSKIISSKMDIIKETSFKLERKPNREYSFKIRAKTCSGLGAFTWLNETCIASKQAPRLVPKPSVAHSINSAGEATLSIAIPDQQNGPISCMFVIVNPDPPDDGDNVSTFTLDDLIESNRSNSSNRTSKKFIAIALKVSRLTFSSYYVTVGNGNIRVCDVNSTDFRANSSSNGENLFFGHNAKLNPAKNHSIFLVTTTPSGGSILLKRSEAAILLGGKEGQADGGNAESGTLVLAVVAGILGFFVFLIGIVLWKKKVFVNAESNKENTRNENMTLQSAQSILTGEYETYRKDSEQSCDISGQTEKRVYEEINNASSTAYETCQFYVNVEECTELERTTAANKAKEPTEKVSHHYEAIN